MCNVPWFARTCVMPTSKSDTHYGISYQSNNWKCLWMRFEGPHNYMVVALGSCVKWPLLLDLILDPTSKIGFSNKEEYFLEWGLPRFGGKAIMSHLLLCILALDPSVDSLRPHFCSRPMVCLILRVLWSCPRVDPYGGFTWGPKHLLNDPSFELKIRAQLEVWFLKLEKVLSWMRIVEIWQK